MIEKIDLKDPLSSSIERGRRLTLMRKIAGFSRLHLQEKYGISASTVQSWESAKAGGLTKRGANIMIEIFRKEGMACAVEWLMHEIGSPPQLQATLQFSQETNLPEDLLPTSEDQNIIQELLLFRKLYKNTLDIKVEDDGMVPYFHPGDYVAGVCYPITSSTLAQLNGLDCIVRTEENHILFRKMRYSKETQICDLLCVNPSASVATPTSYEQTLLLVAPVIWHRKPRVLYQTRRL